MYFGCIEKVHQEGSFEYPQHMFWFRNKKNNFLVYTLILGPADVRPAMLAASQLPGMGSTDVDDAPTPAC